MQSKEIIIEEYKKFNTPVDTLVNDTDKFTKFLNVINAQLEPNTQYTWDNLKSRLLSLRKKGQAKGGLPRLKHQYNGRKTKSVNNDVSNLN
jgi:hypothetical protein